MNRVSAGKKANAYHERKRRHFPSQLQENNENKDDRKSRKLMKLSKGNMPN